MTKEQVKNMVNTFNNRADLNHEEGGREKELSYLQGYALGKAMGYLEAADAMGVFL